MLGWDEEYGIYRHQLLRHTTIGRVGSSHWQFLRRKKVMQKDIPNGKDIHYSLVNIYLVWGPEAPPGLHTITKPLT